MIEKRYVSKVDAKQIPYKVTIGESTIESLPCITLLPRLWSLPHCEGF